MLATLFKELCGIGEVHRYHCTSANCVPIPTGIYNSQLNNRDNFSYFRNEKISCFIVMGIYATDSVLTGVKGVLQL